MAVVGVEGEVVGRATEQVEEAVGAPAELVEGVMRQGARQEGPEVVGPISLTGRASSHIPPPAVGVEEEPSSWQAPRESTSPAQHIGEMGKPRFSAIS